MNVPRSDDVRGSSSAIALSPILISETTDDIRLHNSTSKVRLDNFELTMFEPPPLDSYKKNCAETNFGCYSKVDKKIIEPTWDVSSVSDISGSEASVNECARDTTPILVSKTIDDEHLQDSARTSKMQIDDDLDLGMFALPPLDSIEREYAKEKLDHSSRARVVSFETSDVSESKVPHCEWGPVTKPAAAGPVETDDIYPFPHLEANYPTTFWTIQVLDKGAIPDNKKGSCADDSLWFRVYFQPEGKYVYYRGQEIINCVRDLVEFHGRSVFRLQRMSNGTLEIVRASEITCRLQELFLTF